MQPLDRQPGAASPQVAPAAPDAPLPPAARPAHDATAGAAHAAGRVPETGGPSGPDPARYGDWERRGRCIDF
ncbi:MAG: DUF1674 domain-containing protein [Pseudomonadota bacterium]|nr:DUF1674 domain-containing protein [Pseudomonadota bacterium]